jgi:ABC-2 type transport system permease protein
MNGDFSPLGLLLRVNGLSAWRRLSGLRHESKLLLGVIGGFLLGYLVFAFFLFRLGLAFIGRFPGLGSLLVERLLFLLFALLFGLLLLSNLVICHTNFFRNRETAFLITAPLPISAVFQWKCIESTLLASWAFLFLIAPLLAAYGQLNHVAWHFYPATFAMVLLFVVLPGIGGAALAILVARLLDRRGFQVAAVTGVVVALALLAFRLRPEVASDEVLEARVQSVIDRLLVNTGFAQSPLLPSYWLSACVLNLAEGAVKAAGFYALVLLSHVLFVGRVAMLGLGGAFYSAANTVQSRASAFSRWGWWKRGEARNVSIAAEIRRRWLEPDGSGEPHPAGALFGSPDRLDRGLRALGLAPDVRALVGKDLRVFWRDTTQWGQTVLLFGLLAVYVLNLRHFTRQLDSVFWIGLVSFLNLGACALNVATITTRFVFPQFSLEGRRVWLVGLAPLGLVRVVVLKFWLAGISSLFLTLGMTLMSGHLLGLGWERQVFFGAAVTIMTFTLNAVAVGLGAIYPNFRETNPSKIVSGFGGTFCLVLSFFYILASVIALAMGSPWGWRGEEAGPMKPVVGWTVFVLFSVLAGWLPLRIGLRRVAATEL